MITFNEKSWNFYAKPTEYRGVMMRSKTEARCAKWLDDHDTQWVYESDPFVVDGVQYTPDFYLPKTDTLIEVKPIVFLDEIERVVPVVEKLRKIFAVLSPDHIQEFSITEMFGPLPPCDPFSEQSDWGWMSDCVEHREPYFDDCRGKLPHSYFYMASPCWLLNKDFNEQTKIGGCVCVR